MSVNSALLAGVAGLTANSAKLAAISDNIANVNTTGYKRNQTNFTDVVTSQSVRGRYSAGGVQAVNHQIVSQQGQLQSTSSTTDLAISGDGFFVVSAKAAGISNNDERLFTRAGSFGVDEDGYLINDADLYLLGWPIAADGTVNTSPSDVGTMQPINVKNIGGAVSPTTQSTINANLNSNTPFNPAAYTAGAMKDYDNDPTTAGAVKPDFTIETRVIDSLGGIHNIAISFHRQDPATAPNTWDAEIYAIPVDDVEGGGLIKSGAVAFTSDGKLDMTATTLFGGPTDPTSIALDASGGTAPAWATGLGISGQSILFDLASPNGGLTQFASSSIVNSTSTNGATVGNVVGVQVSDTGVVTAVFDNNEKRDIAQLGVATFVNPDGLTAVSGNAYRASAASGDFALKVPGEGASGKIASSSLEASTVDLATEFTSLITTQRAYSASSKIITTADEMLEELINIKR